MISAAELRERLRPSAHMILFGAITGLAVLAVAVAYLAPMLDASSLKFGASAAPQSLAGSRGKALYDREGCVYCHTMQVRPVSNDVGLGQVTTAQRVVRDSPASFGMARIGPDLSCIGSRQKATDIQKHIAHPRAIVASSNMPAYAFLSPQELSDLAEYLGHLTCDGVKK